MATHEWISVKRPHGLVPNLMIIGWELQKIPVITKTAEPIVMPLVKDPILFVPIRNPRRRRLWELLEGDMYSVRRCQEASWRPARYVIRLWMTPQNVAEYVTSRIPLAPFDWWWVPKTDASGSYIEVSIREAKVLQLVTGSEPATIVQELGQQDEIVATAPDDTEATPEPKLSLVSCGQIGECEIFISLPEGQRQQGIEMLFARLKKEGKEWDAASKRHDAITDRMPDDVADSIRDRWRMAMSTWLNTLETLIQLGYKVT